MPREGLAFALTSVEVTLRPGSRSSALRLQVPLILKLVKVPREGLAFALTSVEVTLRPGSRSSALRLQVPLILKLVKVPREGLEPSRDYSHSILSATRLPVPPPRQVKLEVPKERFELSQDCSYGVLNATRLPVPPLRLSYYIPIFSIKIPVCKF